ncbi:MAG: transglutaminase family protein [Acidisphaera sp.]|nr:transglutaminase family protein [Acidisphaera sp.]
MPRVGVVHTTHYAYVRPVRLTGHRLMIRPRDSHDLRLLEATLTITPPSARTRWAHDVFGNSVCYVDPGETPTDSFSIVSRLQLQHYPAARVAVQLDPVAETYPFSYAVEEFPDLARLLERHHPDPDRRVDRWARSFVNRSGPTDTMGMLSLMTQAIKADFAYRTREAEGTNPPVETLATRSGACRDLALLMMEAVRSLGLAAQFVSGYLYDEGLADSTDPIRGGGATHAWCTVYLPGAGWVEFDPTNGLIAGKNLLRVCSARTPGQAVPVAGGYIGARADFAGLSVNVEVSVGAAVLTEAPEPTGAVPPASPTAHSSAAPAHE